MAREAGAHCGSGRGDRGVRGGGGAAVSRAEGPQPAGNFGGGGGDSAAPHLTGDWPDGGELSDSQRLRRFGGAISAATAETVAGDAGGVCRIRDEPQPDVDVGRDSVAVSLVSGMGIFARGGGKDFRADRAGVLDRLLFSGGNGVFARSDADPRTRSDSADEHILAWSNAAWRFGHISARMRDRQIGWHWPLANCFSAGAVGADASRRRFVRYVVAGGSRLHTFAPGAWNDLLAIC